MFLPLLDFLFVSIGSGNSCPQTPLSSHCQNNWSMLECYPRHTFASNNNNIAWRAPRNPSLHSRRLSYWTHHLESKLQPWSRESTTVPSFSKILQLFGLFWCKNFQRAQNPPNRKGKTFYNLKQSSSVSDEIHTVRRLNNTTVHKNIINKMYDGNQTKRIEYLNSIRALSRLGPVEVLKRKILIFPILTVFIKNFVLTCVYS